MLVTTAGAEAPAPPAFPPAKAPAAPTDPTASASVTDSVSLSPAAQAILAAPNGAGLTAALAAVNDESGRTALTQQLAAYDLLTTYANAKAEPSAARDAVLKSFQASAFAAHVASVSAQINSPILSADVGQANLDRLNRLTPDDQQIAFHLQSLAKPGAFASLDTLKANDRTRSDVQKVIGKIFAKFGGDDLTKLTDPRLTKNAAFQALLNLMKDDPESDGWTVKAKQVLSDLAKSLDLVPDDPKAKAMADAVKTLKAPPPITVEQAMAFKALKRVTDDLQKARDDQAADATGRPRKSAAGDADKTRDKPKKGAIDWTVATVPAPPPLAAYVPGAALNTLA